MRVHLLSGALLQSATEEHCFISLLQQGLSVSTASIQHYKVTSCVCMTPNLNTASIKAGGGNNCKLFFVEIFVNMDFIL